MYAATLVSGWLMGGCGFAMTGAVLAQQQVEQTQRNKEAARVEQAMEEAFAAGDYKRVQKLYMSHNGVYTERMTELWGESFRAESHRQAEEQRERQRAAEEQAKRLARVREAAEATRNEASALGELIGDRGKVVLVSMLAAMPARDMSRMEVDPW